MKKVRFNSKLEHEWLNNFKVMVTAFQDLNVDKVGIFCYLMLFFSLLVR